MTIQVPIRSPSYAWARRAQRVFLSIFLCLCLRIFLRRFLITEPKLSPRRASAPEGDPGGESYRKQPPGRSGLHSTPMYFTDAHDELRLHIRKFLTTEVQPHLEEWEEKTFPDSIFKRFGELGMAVDVQTEMATPPVFKFGTEEQKRKWLVPAIRGEHIAALAITEP